jgi:hypothetical protein
MSSFSFDKSPQRDTLYMKGELLPLNCLGGYMKTVFQSLSHIDSGDAIDLWNDFDFEPLFLSVDPINQWFAVTPDRRSTVKCHNRASAVAYATGRLPSRSAEPVQTRVNVTAFVSPSGQYYVMHGNQRMDVANAQTARYYVKNGVDVNTLLTACLATLNQ